MTDATKARRKLRSYLSGFAHEPDNKTACITVEQRLCAHESILTLGELRALSAEPAGVAAPTPDHLPMTAADFDAAILKAMQHGLYGDFAQKVYCEAARLCHSVERELGWASWGELTGDERRGFLRIALEWYDDPEVEGLRAWLGVCGLSVAHGSGKG